MEKQRWEESGKRKEEERRSAEKRKSQKKKMQAHEKVQKSQNIVSFQWFVASKLAKAVGAEPSGPMRNEKLHAIVARSTFGSENIKNTSRPEHFCQLTCRKSERRCGAKHIWKSKCAKHHMFGALLEVEMFKKCFRSKRAKHTTFGTLLEVEIFKKCTALWREAHLEVKMCKTQQCRTTFGS